MPMGYFHDPFRAGHSETDHDTTVEPQEPAVEPVPSGTTKEVLAWVGDNKERAQRALDVELASDKPRVTLVTELQAIIEA